MSYTPKPGDRVTSPLLVGEWEVWGGVGLDTHRLTVLADPSIVLIRHGNGEGVRRTVTVSADTLTPVAPPLPPEPPVGSVVWAWDRHYWRSWDSRWYCGDGKTHARWEFLAADAVPVVPVTKVADYVRTLRPNIADCADVAADLILAEFGGFDE